MSGQFHGSSACLKGAYVVLQMDLRERETAAAVEDLEVRQMELEAQRRQLEQVTNTLHSTFLPLSSSD